MSTMKHGIPPEGMECACCFDDIEGGKGGNYVEYRTGEGNPWRPSLFCKMCIEVLIKRQWSIYEEGLAKATCKAQQKRMLGDGPPTHVNDKKALSCEEGESVHSLWYVRDEDGEPQIQSAELEGAPQGEARQIWWDEKLAFQFDEDDDEEDGEGGESTNSTAPPSASTPPPAPGTPAGPSASSAAVSPPPVPTATAAAAAAATAATATADAGVAKKQGGEGEGSAAAPEGSPEAASGGGAIAAGPEGAQTGVTPPKMPMEEENPTPAPLVAADPTSAPSVPSA